jgi:hypothetical protein
MRAWLTAGLCCLGLAGWGASDDLVLKDGTVVQCQVYKETKTTVFYVRPNDQLGSKDRTEIKEVKYGVKPVVDLKAFLERQGAKLSAEVKADLQAALNRKGRTTMRSLKDGVTVRDTADANTPELIVDPFTEEGTPKKK